MIYIIKSEEELEAENNQMLEYIAEHPGCRTIDIIERYHDPFIYFWAIRTNDAKRKAEVDDRFIRQMRPPLLTLEQSVEKKRKYITFHHIIQI